jgi:hypothetical protein
VYISSLNGNGGSGIEAQRICGGRPCNAVAHGWYDKPVEFPEVAALIHSEVSEALAEYRDGRPAVYGSVKPQGVAVELCDAIMRILDYLAFLGVDIEATLEAKYDFNIGRPYRHGGKRV